MRIERTYHTDAMKQLDKIDGVSRMIQGSMTEEEKEAEKREDQRGFQRLLERIERTG